MAAPAPVYTGTPELQKLKHVIIGWIDPTITNANFNTGPIGMAFDTAGIRGYNDLVMLQPDDIRGMSNGAVGTIPIVQAHKITAVVAFHHHMSRILKHVFDPQTLGHLEFNDFLTAIYNPTKLIVPWTSLIKDDNPLLEQWRKNIKPSLADYKEFREEKYYQIWRQKTVNTIEAHGLQHLIDPNHVPLDKDYDAAQRNWLFKAFESTFLAGYARSLIKKYQDTKDT